MKAITKSLLTLTLAASSLVALPACTDGEIIATSIIIGAAIIDDDDNGSHHHGRIGHGHPHCRNHHEIGCGRGSLRGSGRGHAFSLRSMDVADEAAAAEQVAVPEFVSSDARVIKTAEKYDISHYAATYVVRAIVLAKAKDLSGLAEIGLEKSDLKKIYRGKALTSDKLAAMSARLLLSEEATAQLVDDMTADIQAKKEGLN